jgi:hypothetical protein
MRFRAVGGVRFTLEANSPSIIYQVDDTVMDLEGTEMKGGEGTQGVFGDNNSAIKGKIGGSSGNMAVDAVEEGSIVTDVSSGQAEGEPQVGERKANQFAAQEASKELGLVTRGLGVRGRI